MKEISISEFRTHCSRLIWEVSKTKQPIRITRPGRLWLRFIRLRRRLGLDWAYEGQLEILGDIVGPTSESDWDVLKE